MTAQALYFRPTGTSPEQIEAYCGLLNATFRTDSFNPEGLVWRYRDNPTGRVVGVDAWDGGRLAAHYVTCPLQARVEGRVVKGLLSLNTATHPDYQGRGLFTTLAEQAYAAGKAAGYRFVIGVANANSTPGFLKKLSFQHVGRLRAGVLALLPGRFTDAPLQYEGVWNRKTLAWRLNNPEFRYTAMRRNGLIRVWSRTHLPGVQAVAFLPDGGQPLRAGDVPPALSLFLGLEPRLSFSRLGFVPIPDVLRPSPLNLIWRALDPALPVALRPDAVALNFLDFDPY